jgi:hypothetical protein
VTPETGESTASIKRRRDDEAWPRIREQLVGGAHLRYVQRLGIVDLASAATHYWGPRTISRERLAELINSGELTEVSINRYQVTCLAEVR